MLASFGSTLALAQSSQVFSISDAVQADLASFAGGAKGCDAGCDAACDASCGKSDVGESCEPWRLFPEFGCGWEVNGWVAMGATANADDPRSWPPVVIGSTRVFPFPWHTAILVALGQRGDSRGQMPQVMMIDRRSGPIAEGWPLFVEPLSLDA